MRGSLNVDLTITLLLILALLSRFENSSAEPTVHIRNPLHNGQYDRMYLFHKKKSGGI